MFYREVLEIETKKSGNFLDITEDVIKTVNKCKLKEGLCHLFMPATTAAIITNENERMLMEDFKRMFNELAAETRLYNHPDNAFSHLRSALMGTEKTIPIFRGKLLLGMWQQILLWEFDTRPRTRKIIVTITG